MPERPEILSTARPSAVRLWGFLFLVVGAVVAGLGALMDWATLGFPGDERGALDVAVKGIDVWEGKVVLASAVLALVGMVAMRLARGTETRRVLAFGIATLGALVIAVALSVAIRADARLGGSEGLDEISGGLAEQLGEDPAAVRAQLEQQYGEQLRVDLGPGVWVAVVGGVLIDVGGALGLLWVKQRAEAAPAPGEIDASPTP
ncbi:MAG TPA: Trp biosynthesis-associated membrane protein [Actinomycetota bacterium]|nr:Trp biosynthesis-associated membrane protein [Actinomycetota bacterium]